MVNPLNRYGPVSKPNRLILGNLKAEEYPQYLKSNSREIGSKGERSRPAVDRCSIHRTQWQGVWATFSKGGCCKGSKQLH